MYGWDGYTDHCGGYPAEIIAEILEGDPFSKYIRVRSSVCIRIYNNDFHDPIKFLLEYSSSQYN